MQVCGTFQIDNLASSGTVTGLQLDSGLIPRRVFPRVRKPSGGFNMFACIVDGTVTSDGFQFTLTGQTDSANYFLDYLMIVRPATPL